MSTNYAKQLPRDKSGELMQEYYPPFKALAQNMRNNLTVSSVFTLNDSTSVVEIAANGSPVAMRWVPVTETAGTSPFASVITTIGTENFDHIIAKDTVKQFVVPIETQGTSSVVGINKQAGLYNRIAVMSGAAVSSVMVSEF